MAEAGAEQPVKEMRDLRNRWNAAPMMEWRFSFSSLAA
jgi:hypothetical protein